MQDKTAHGIRAPELAVLRSSAVANLPSDGGAYSAGNPGGRTLLATLRNQSSSGATREYQARLCHYGRRGYPILTLVQ